MIRRIFREDLIKRGEEYDRKKIETKINESNDPTTSPERWMYTVCAKGIRSITVNHPHL